MVKSAFFVRIRYQNHQGQVVFKAGQDFYKNYSSAVVLVLMIIWVVLLIIGTIAELFDLQGILDWPIWHPPGKYK